MANKAKHAFGALEQVDTAISDGKIDSYDILFVKDANGKPYVGWVDKEGQKVICNDSAELAELENQIATKADAKEIEHSYEKIKYEIANVPVGTLVDYGEREIRVMCPENSAWTKQSVGTGGDPNNYYMTFKTYVYDDRVAGYIEHLGDKVDSEILTDLKTDEYGRRYQPTWLALARYDEITDTWNYYGKSSTSEKFVGWDYQIDFYDANGVMIASDCIRINLSNEECHFAIKPYYGVSEAEEIETKVEEVVEEKMIVKVEETLNSANAYTDAKIAEIEEAASYTIVEF